MKTYTLTTKDGLDIKFKDEQTYRLVMEEYREKGSVSVDGQLIERHQNPVFRSHGEDLSRILPAVFPEVRTSKEEEQWQTEVLSYNLTRVSSRTKPVYTYWHYKAARVISGSWVFSDTLSVLRTESFEIVDADAKRLESEYKPEHISSKSGCGKCTNGWVPGSMKHSVRPCGCKDSVNNSYKEYLAKYQF